MVKHNATIVCPLQIMVHMQCPDLIQNHCGKVLILWLSRKNNLGCVFAVYIHTPNRYGLYHYKYLST